MGFKIIQPNGKCETCRNSELVTFGDGWNEPRMQELECRVGDALESLEELHSEVAEKMGYEPYGTEYGSSDPCPFYRALPPCTSHPEHLSGLCPECEVEADEAEAKALEEEAKMAEEYWSSQG